MQLSQQAITDFKKIPSNQDQEIDFQITALCDLIIDSYLLSRKNIKNKKLAIDKKHDNC